MDLQPASAVPAIEMGATVEDIALTIYQTRRFPSAESLSSLKGCLSALSSNVGFHNPVFPFFLANRRMI